MSETYYGLYPKTLRQADGWTEMDNYVVEYAVKSELQNLGRSTQKRQKEIERAKCHALENRNDNVSTTHCLKISYDSFEVN